MRNHSHDATYISGKFDYNTKEQINAQPLFDNLIWITTEEAADLLRKSGHALRQMVYKGQIRARKVCGRLYFNKLELHQFIDLSHYQ